MAYWLMKSEPEAFSIDDLKNEAKATTHWDGIRNYQARNFMRQMDVGDMAFFYHSNAKPPGIVGTMKVVRTSYTDFTAFDVNDPHYDEKSKPDAPRWDMVDVKFVKKFPRLLSLDELRQHKALSSMTLLRKGNRLSIMPITETQWKYILKLI